MTLARSHPRRAAFLRFAAGGALSFSVTVGTTALLHELLELDEPIAAAGGIAAALVVNFLSMRYFVFRGTAMPPLRQALMFVSSSGLFRGAEYVGFLGLHLLLGVRYLAALFVVLCTSFLVKFFVYDRWIFARAASTSGAGDRAPWIDV